LALRKRLRAHGGIETVTPDEPAAVTLWRLRDQLELRDFFLDRGWLDLAGADGEPSALCLHVWGLHEDAPLPACRARFYLEPEGFPTGTRAAAKACIHDHAEVVTGGLRLKEALTPAARSEAAPPLGGDTAPVYGTWQVLSRLVDSLDDEDARALFDRTVLRPSRAKEGGNPDHALAERLFVQHFAAGIGPAQGDDPIWRRTFCAHLLPYLDGSGPRALPDRLAAEAAFGRFRLEAVGPVWRCIHLPACRAEELMRLRLALPVGAVLAAESGSRLGQTSARLNTTGARLLDGDRLVERPKPARRRPPVWGPRHLLIDDNFWGLEEEFARGFTFLEKCMGLDSFEIGRSLTASGDCDTLVVTARCLSGLTRSGRLVEIDTDDALTARLPRAGDGPMTFDAWIEVTHAPPAEEDDEPVRERLRVEWVGDVADPRKIPAPFCLDLGRFAGRLGTGLRLVRRPLVRTFAALRPHDDAWRSWVAPLREALDALLRADGGAGDELRALAHDWSILPLNLLAWRLVRLARLRAWRPSDGALRTPPEAPNLDRASGDDLPALLARLSVPAPAPARRERRLLPGPDGDFEPYPDGHALALRLLTELSGGCLELRPWQPCPQVPPLMLDGPGVAQPLVATNDGRLVYTSLPLWAARKDKLLLTPLRYVWDGSMTAEIWYVEETHA
jgi:hypothetical protein